VQINSHRHTKFADELRFIPRWAQLLAAFLLVCIPIVFTVVMAHDPRRLRFGNESASASSAESSLASTSCSLAM